METIERRLAAILAVDVVGFSRMMGTDEAGTLERLKAVRAEITDPAISRGQGRIVKEMGDGLLVQFDSAVNAVQCAIDIQEQVRERNAGLPDAEAMRLRMGINLGDVIIEGDDIYGDGVNIAARLEPLADVGGVLVSAAVYESALNKVSAGFEGLGEQKLKNTGHPVRVYRVRLQGTATGTAARGRRSGRPGKLIAAAVGLVVAGAAIWYQLQPPTPGPEAAVRNAQPPAPANGAPIPALADKPTVAVMPFSNFSDDKDQDYFSDGLTEDLITDISKVSGLRVIARNSTFAYKGKSADVRAVSEALGATHIVEGSVRKADGKVRINVQLIDAATGNHIWAERYDRHLKEIFAVQDEVIGKIIGMLAIKLSADEKARVAKHGTENLEAYDLLIRGRQQESFFNPTANAQAIRFYEQAIAADPDYAEAYAHLSIVKGLVATFGSVANIDPWLADSVRLAERAVQLDPSMPLAHFALGRILSRPQIADYPRAVAAFERGLQLDPSHADSYANLAFVAIFTGKAETARVHIETAMRMNPHYPFWYLFARAMASYLIGDYPSAVDDLTTANQRNPTVVFVRYWLAAALAQAGKIEDATWQVDELRSMGYADSRQQLLAKNPIAFAPYKEKLGEGLAKAGFD